MLTVPVHTVRTVRTVTLQGRTIRMMMCQGDDVAHSYWLMVVE